MKTTKEQADIDIHNNLVNNLQELLEKNVDAEKGFAKAMQDAKNANLKNFLKHQAAQHGRFVNELDQEIRNLNETPKEGGSVTGKLHRTWIDIKTALTGENDEAVLEECIRGEKASLEEYEERIKQNNFPPQVETILTNQLGEIRGTLSRVKTLEDIADSIN
ncbi:PA2169 family four-helix-bundle protein [Rasiella rasia]|uniref:PA2169 family four-helix-bundle protein n=1 Tax=Rasiella rasia TaxID=2744027 RepID=A0A6G6GJT6_9FLAO|nr:PA2169 family four-helix-bundle protein [Rasiella rasia]QIE58808.1 PA2169 family four-helix-bundle protein [Rasiella rasia]